MGEFGEIKKNFGLGCMRLPTLPNGDIDKDAFCEMVDYFISEGFNYFDTAKMYHSGKSEEAIGECIAKRYPRDKFVLTDKLSTSCFTTEEEIIPLFENQLKTCHVDYFDFYLMHAQSRELFEKYKKCHAYEKALEFKKQGKIKHFGISFHDSAEVLEQILNEYPQIEVVQLQFNYIDYDDPAVQSRKCYDVCVKHKKPVIVMEPVKGGNLANLPDNARKFIDDLGEFSPAAYAIRFAASFENNIMVLSGMSNMEQLKENLSFMKDFVPLNDKEKEAIKNVCSAFREMRLVPCTACRYCTDGCPKNISIPDLFSCLNSKHLYKGWNSRYYYEEVYTKYNGKASDCIQCGKCEKACPQHLPVRKLLKTVAEEFEN